ncbi:MAG: transporter associated domain-containing protein, partial [Candidatus Dormibacteraceae bacterium]
EEEEEFRVLDEHSAQVDARYSMEDLSEELHLGIPESDDYDSVGGYVLDVLGTVPEAGTSFDAGGVHWTVTQVDGNRVLRVLLRSDEPWPDDTLVDAGLKEPSPRQLPAEDAE